MDKNLRLSILLKAGGNALGFLRGVKTESDRTSTALNSAREKVQALQRTTKDVGAFRQMEARLDGTRGKIAAHRAEVERLGAAMDATDAPSKQMIRGFELEKTKLQELTVKERGQIAALTDLKGRLEGAGVATNALGAHELKLARDLSRANDELTEQARRMDAVNDRRSRMGAARGRYDKTQQLAGTMQGSGASALAGGVITAAPLFAAASAGMSFENGMADIKKVVDFPTPVAFRQMEKDILSLSTRIPVATEGLTAIIAAAGQAGIARGELMGFAEDAGKMGIAFDTTADDAGKKMATWRTAFRLTQTEVKGLADQINYLGNNGPANALSISNVVTRVGALGEVAGLSAGQIAALGSTVVGMGVEEEIAATGIKNTMLALTKGTAATKSQKAAYAALGLEATDMAKRMQTDAGGAIVDVMTRISKLSKEKQTSILTQLFGSESVSAIAPMLNNLDLLKTNLNRVGDATLYAGSMQKEYEARAATTSNAVLLMKQGVKAVAIEIGTAFLPQIKQGAAFLGQMAQKIHVFAQAHPGAIRAIGMLVAIIAGALVVFGGLAMAIAAILGPFALLQLTLTQTGIMFGPAGLKIAEFAGKTLPALGRALGSAGRAVLSFAGKALPMIGRGLIIAGRGFLSFGAMAARAGLMLLANPITWIVLGIVAAVALLAGAAYLIYRNWGTIGPWLGRMWEGIKTGVSNALGFMGRLFMNFSPVGMMISAVMRAWPALQALGGRFMDMGRDLLKGLINGVRSGVPALVAAVVSNGGALIAGIAGLMNQGTGAITSVLSGIWTTIKSSVSSAIGGMVRIFLTFSPVGILVSSIMHAWPAVQALGGRFSEGGRHLMTALTNGVLGGIPILVATVMSVGRFMVTGTLNAIMGAASALDDLGGRFLDMGRHLLTSLIDGVLIGIPAVVAAVTNAGRSMLIGIGYFLAQNLSAIITTLSGLWATVGSSVSTAIGGMLSTIMSFNPVGILISSIMRAWPALQALGGRFLEMGRHLLTGLVNGVLGGIPALVAAVMRAGGAVVTAFKNKLGIHSPSRVFAQLGDYTMQGLGIGLGRSARDPLRRMRTAASAITAAGAMAIGTGAMAAPTFDTAPTLGARPASAATAAPPPVTIGTLNLQIVQRPGEDMEALAQRVAELLKNPTGGASFSDDDDSYSEAP